VVWQMIANISEDSAPFTFKEEKVSFSNWHLLEMSWHFPVLRPHCTLDRRAGLMVWMRR